MTDKPKLLNENVAIGVRRRSLLNRGAIKVLVAFGVTTLLASAVYYLLGTYTETGSIEATFDQGGAECRLPSYGDYLHFSFMTITTLGYGDFRPVAWGRVVAGLEVAIGMVLLGLFVSKIVSADQERLIGRLASGQLNAQLRNFREKIDSLNIELHALLKRFQQEKTSEVDKLRLHGAADRPKEAILDEFAALLRAVARYWRSECQRGDFYRIASPRSIGRILGSFHDALLGICDIHNILSAGDRKLFLTVRNFKNLRNITDSCLTMSRSAACDGKLGEYVHQSNRVNDLVTNLHKMYDLKHLPHQLANSKRRSHLRIDHAD